jgi:hypothetical protein
MLDDVGCLLQPVDLLHRDLEPACNGAVGLFIQDREDS